MLLILIINTGEEVKAINNKLKTLFVLILFFISFLYLTPSSLSDSMPEQLWSKFYDSSKNDMAQGLAIDSNNNIFVTGYMENINKEEIIIIKYDEYGNTIFNKKFESYYSCRAYDICVDIQNNVIIGGFVDINGYKDFLLIKYDNNGNLIWNITDHVSDDDTIYGIDADTNANIIYTGKANNSFYTAKIDSNGVEIWNQSYNFQNDAVSKSVTINLDNDIIICGYVTYSSNRECKIIKYNSNGVLEWIKTHSDSNYNNAEGIITDQDNNIYITGTKIIEGSSDFLILKYFSNGTLVFSKTYDISIMDAGADITLNQNGEIFLTGNVINTHEQKNIAVLKFSNSGNYIWSETYDVNNDYDYGTSIAVDNQNKIIFTGFTKGLHNYNFITMKFAEKPTANFTWNPINPTTKDNIEFIDQSIDPAGYITDWSWDFGDGYSSDLQNPNHQYQNTGFYTVTLTITDDDSNIDTISKQIEIVNSPPNADFTFQKSTSSNSIIEFFDQSSDFDGTITNYLWDFDDGTNSTDQNPIHQFSEFKTFQVSLTVWDNEGDYNTITKNVEVTNIPPNADFNYQKSTISNDIIEFTDESTDTDGTIISWFWDFSDGTNSTEQNPVHEFSDFKTYQVSLKVYDNDGYDDLIIKDVNVVNNPPISDFNFNIISENLVEFNESSTDSDGTIISYFWEFGDGNFSYQKNVSHQYQNYGTFNISLTVTDNNGFNDTKTKLVSTIYPPSKITGLNITDAKDGKLNLIWNNCLDQLPIEKYKIYRDGNFLNYSYQNNYQDKNLTNNQSYSYQISAINIFSIEGEKSDIVSGTPTITEGEENTTNDEDDTNNNNNQQNSGYIGKGKTNNLPIDKYEPIADASAGEPYYAYVNEEIIFNASESYDPDGEIINYTWDFGDGNNSYNIETSHIYENQGSYNLILTVIDNDGLIDTYETQIQINLPNRAPEKPYIYGPNNGSKKENYSFNFKSYDEDLDDLFYNISFGDGTIITTDTYKNNENATVNHSWNLAGKYEIEAYANDNKTISEKSNHIIFIDSIEISYNNSKIGYIIDENGDGTYDLFYSYESNNISLIDKTNDSNYLIDLDSDGEPDLIYNETSKTTEQYNNEYKSNKAGNANNVICPISIIFILIIILLYLFLKRKKEKPKKTKKENKEIIKPEKIKIKEEKYKMPKDESIYNMNIDEIEDYVNKLIDEQNNLFSNNN